MPMSNPEVTAKEVGEALLSAARGLTAISLTNSNKRWSRKRSELVGFQVGDWKIVLRSDRGYLAMVHSARSPDGRLSYCGEWAMSCDDKQMDSALTPLAWLTTHEGDELTRRLFEVSGEAT